VISVVLADDQAVVRDGLRVILEAQGDIKVVAEASDGVEAVEHARRSRPDVVVMDIRMPVLDGVEATRRLAADPEMTNVRVLVLTTYDDDELVFQALRAGAGGFLLKDADPEDLVRGVRVLASGEALLAPSVTRRLVEAFAARPEPATPPPSMAKALTEREREVVALVGTGLSNGEIATRLVISPATARTHVSRAMGKIGARDRAQVVVFAYESGLVVPSRPPRSSPAV
jgi:DNA-binding NarL/FixJ family response regulator